MGPNGEEVLRDVVENAHHDLEPNQAIDPTTIIAIITAILEAIRGCRNQAKARDHVQRGSVVAILAARRAIVQSGYQGNALALARKMAANGSTLTEASLEAVFDLVEDIPTPPPAGGGGGWPVWSVLFCLVAGLMMTSTAHAQWPTDFHQVTTTGWPVSIVTTPDITSTPPAVITRTPEVEEFDLEIPDSRPWTFPGDNGTRERVIKHLVEHSNHRIDPQWLADLSYSELKALHSADHNGLMGDHLRQGSNPGKSTTANVVQVSNPTRSTAKVVQGSNPTGWVKKTVPAGLFGRQTKTVWTWQGSTAAGYSGGCPGGSCPR